jgi:hypothetical protein
MRTRWARRGAVSEGEGCLDWELPNATVGATAREEGGGRRARDDDERGAGDAGDEEP